MRWTDLNCRFVAMNRCRIDLWMCFDSSFCFAYAALQVWVRQISRTGIMQRIGGRDGQKWPWKRWSKVTVVSLVKTGRPYVLLLTVSACNMRQITLTWSHADGIDHMLREIIVYIGHSKNWPIIQILVRRNLDTVIVQLLVVAKSPTFRKALWVPGEKALVGGMTFANDTFVQQA